jgi:hypothetical protein
MEKLLERIVRLHGVEVGVVVDVILDSEREEPIGLEVRCKDGRHRFLALASAAPIDGELAINSPFALLDGDELEFYRRRGATLRQRGGPTP